MAIQLYFWLYLFAYVFCFFDMLSSGDYATEKIYLAGFSIAMSYAICVLLYKHYKNKNYNNTRIKFEYNEKRLNLFVSVLLIIMIFYAIRTGDGRAASASVNSQSMFASLFPVEGIFLYYYCMCRESNRRAVWFNTALYIIYNLICAFAGVFFVIAILELHFYKPQKIGGYKMPLYTFGAYVIGGFMYSILYPVKFALRMGTPVSMSDKLPLMDGIVKLCERFSHLNTTVYADSNADMLVNRYLSQDIALMETKAYFRPIIPGSIFKNKVYSNLGNVVHNSMSGYKLTNGTDSPSLLTYMKLLLKSDALDFAGWLLLIVLSLLLIRYICRCFQKYDGQFDFLYFWIIINSLSICGNLESVFTNRYIKIVFFLPLLWVLGIIKVYRIRRD